jgi:hypothetical protein
VSAAVLEVPAVTTPPAPCPPWCGADHSRPDPDGEYHHGTVGGLTATDEGFDGDDHHRPVWVMLDRLDGDIDNPVQGAASVCVDSDPAGPHTCTAMTPAEAVALAALLVQAAFVAAGELELQAQEIRIGDQVLTSRGWQTVESVLVNTAGPAVELFTVEEYGSDEGFRYAPTRLVRVRRGVAQ